ncbi:hypothetical protein [Neobacillus massiliamazoniensis]|uniref:hypothetical protein n=1 Tax=Neobacillus massiliamazoniensis TaxID=1499688 RepID=UPI00159EE6D3|nr:hypothetical protein [Neobacillus massiliamazoniensis]
MKNVDLNEIVGTHGKISFSTFGNDPVILTTANGKEEWSFEPLKYVRQSLVQTIVSELTGNGSHCPCTILR